MGADIEGIVTHDPRQLDSAAWKLDSAANLRTSQSRLTSIAAYVRLFAVGTSPALRVLEGAHRPCVPRDTGCVRRRERLYVPLTLRSRLSRGGMKATRIRRLGPLMGYKGYKELSSSTNTLPRSRQPGSAVSLQLVAAEGRNQLDEYQGWADNSQSSTLGCRRSFTSRSEPFRCWSLAPRSLHLRQLGRAQ